MATSLPTKPVAGITFPATPLVQAAFKYIQEHNIPSTVNHCMRSAIFALAAVSQNPEWASSIHQETLVVAVLLHDLGWSTSTSPKLQTPHKRFEIDGADAARDFLASNANGNNKADNNNDNDDQIKQVWYAISLHTNPSISLHAPHPLVVATSVGIMADFLGPMTPPFATTAITEDVFREVLRAYPRIGFAEDTKQILCGLCVNKPETTFDNFVGQFGRSFVPGFAEKWEAGSFENTAWKALEATAVYES